MPDKGKARINRKRTIDQRNADIKVFAKTRKHKRGTADYCGIIRDRVKGLPRKTESDTAVRLGIVGPTIRIELHPTPCCKHKRRTVLRVALNCLPEQDACLTDA